MPTTPWDTIPDFGANATITAAASGNWSNPFTWTPARVPLAGDVVSIPSGLTMTYDWDGASILDTVAIHGTLTFRTDLTTRLTLLNLLVYADGTLTVGPVSSGVQAEIVFADAPLTDTDEYGHGLIALGKVTLRGAPVTSFLPLAAEAHIGSTTLLLSQAVTGWKAGDTLFLPDTRDLDAGQRGGGNGDVYVPQWETATIQAISADGRTITLTAGLAHDHLGGHKTDGTLVYLPDVANMSRNVSVHSANASGVRGWCMFTYRANVDVEYCSFGGLGRTKIDGSTHDDRYAVTFAHLMGPYPTVNGQQFSFIGNVITCPLSPMPYLWGISLIDSHYGLIKDNVVINWAGAGVTLDTGNESYNVIDHNFVSRINGTGNRMNGGTDGLGFWIHNPLNFVRNNVANGINPGGTYSYGFSIDLLSTDDNPVESMQRIPNFQGADTSLDMQVTVTSMNAVALKQFENNTVYGATPNGLTIWWLNAVNNEPRSGPGSLIKNFACWNIYQWGVFFYQQKDLTIDGFACVGDNAVMLNNGGATGFKFQDYYTNNLTVKNASFENLAIGIETPVFTDSTTFNLQNTTIRAQVGLSLSTPWTVGPTADALRPLTLIFTNVLCDLAAVPYSVAIDPGYPFDWEIQQHTTTYGLIVSQPVKCYNWGNVAGDNFQMFWTQQAASYVVPQTVRNTDGTSKILGSPVSGLTNAQNWAQYGIAIFGAVAPADATTRDGINGLVKAI